MSEPAENDFCGPRYDSFCALVSPILRRTLSLAADEPTLRDRVDELFAAVPEWIREEPPAPADSPPPLYPYALLEPDEVDEMDPIFREMLFPPKESQPM